MSQVRIIGGTFRRRKIQFMAVEGVRPTPDRIRETLFNWLDTDVRGANCLDLFAGSGALGFEALSRGAKGVTFVESNRQVADCLKQNAEHFELEISIICDDAFSFLLRPTPVSFDIIFLDPPFHQGRITELLALLREGTWLSQDALIYIEVESSWCVKNLPKNFDLLKEKKTGQIKYLLVQCEFKDS